MSYDIYSILQDYKEQNPDESVKKVSDQNNNNDDTAAEITAVRNTIKQNIHNEVIDDIADKEYQKEKNEIEEKESRLDIDVPEYQRTLMSKLLNSLTVKNAQKIIILSNREDARKGLNNEVSSSNKNMMKAIGKNQISTIAIPTQLLRYVQQEIGSLSTRVTQNDIITGFLYWYFGKPEDMMFSDSETISKIEEIVENLDINGSPARLNRLNYNTSSALLDKLETLNEQLDLISSNMTVSVRDAMESKTRMEKMYIALCYNILNMLAFTPPIMPGEQPNDVDLLAGGAVWDLMSGIDLAYDYYKTKNGREIYKSKMHKKAQPFNYNQASTTTVPANSVFEQPVQPNYNDNPNEYDESDNYDDYYGDDYDDYDDVDLDEYDRMLTDEVCYREDADNNASFGGSTLEDIKAHRNAQKRIGTMFNTPVKVINNGEQ